jgi:hypothetical protein
MGLVVYLVVCAVLMAVLPTRHGGKVGLLFAVAAVYVAVLAGR